MARTKTPKPKITTTRDVNPAELKTLGRELISELCPNLRNASIVYIMQTRINEGNDDKPVAPRVGEKYGSTKAMSLLHRLIHHEDFWIVISGNWWAKLSDHQKRAMLYRHLCACELYNGKPLLHKPDFVGYNSEVKHFGAWDESLQSAHELLGPYQLRLDGTDEAEEADLAEEVAGEPATTPALAAAEDPFGDEEAEPSEMMEELAGVSG